MVEPGGAEHVSGRFGSLLRSMGVSQEVRLKDKLKGNQPEGVTTFEKPPTFGCWVVVRLTAKKHSWNDPQQLSTKVPPNEDALLWTQLLDFGFLLLDLGMCSVWRRGFFKPLMKVTSAMAKAGDLRLWRAIN